MPYSINRERRLWLHCRCGKFSFYGLEFEAIAAWERHVLSGLAENPAYSKSPVCSTVTIPELHILHTRMCYCLNSSAVCCIQRCPCHQEKVLPNTDASDISDISDISDTSEKQDSNLRLITSGQSSSHQVTSGRVTSGRVTADSIFSEPILTVIDEELCTYTLEDIRSCHSLINNLAEVLRTRLSQRNMSIRQAASEIGIHRQSLARILSGYDCSVESMLLILAWMARKGNLDV